MRVFFIRSFKDQKSMVRSEHQQHFQESIYLCPIKFHVNCVMCTCAGARNFSRSPQQIYEILYKYQTEYEFTATHTHIINTKKSMHYYRLIKRERKNESACFPFANRMQPSLIFHYFACIIFIYRKKKRKNLGHNLHLKLASNEMSALFVW